MCSSLCGCVWRTLTMMPNLKHFDAKFSCELMLWIKVTELHRFSAFATEHTHHVWQPHPYLMTYFCTLRLSRLRCSRRLRLSWGSPLIVEDECTFTPFSMSLIIQWSCFLPRQLWIARSLGLNGKIPFLNVPTRHVTRLSWCSNQMPKFTSCSWFQTFVHACLELQVPQSEAAVVQQTNQIRRDSSKQERQRSVKTKQKTETTLN